MNATRPQGDAWRPLKRVARRIERLWLLRRAWPAIARRRLAARRSLRRLGGRVVFVDLGAYTGDTIEQAMVQHPEAAVFLGFEPAPDRYARLAETFRRDPRVVTYRAAAGVRAQRDARLYREGQDPGRAYYDGAGDSLYAGKKNVDAGRFDLVEVVDFPRFASEHFGPADSVILKCDIEGGEYDLLEKMIEDGTIGLVKKLYCEWHHQKLNIPGERHERLVQALQRIGFDVTGRNVHDEFSGQR